MNSSKDKLQELKRKIDHYQVENNTRINSSKKKGDYDPVYYEGKSIEFMYKKFPNLFYTTVGFHPHNAKNFKEKDLESIETLAKNPHVISIGECGVDYYREYSPKNQQIVCFEKQLSLNTKLNLPLFLHERGAHNDFCFLLKKYIDKIDNTVVHCFTGTKQELLQYLDLGCYIGITGWITDMDRGSHLHEIIQYIPEDRLLVETDSPYLIPKNMNDNRKTTNEPAYLPYVVEEIKKEDLEINQTLNFVK